MPPIWFLMSLLAMSILYLAIPVATWLSWPWTAPGLPLIAAGIAGMVWAARLFHSRGTTIRPFETSSALIVDGPYRVTRNPMYLGMVLILAGAAVLMGTVTPLAVIPLFVVIITYLFLVEEERMLADRFGEAYADYRGKVRRWI